MAHEINEIIATQKIKEKDVRDMIKDEENFLNNFYDDFFAGMIFPQGQKSMKTDKFVEVLSRDQFQYIFDGKRLRDKFINFASLL